MPNKILTLTTDFGMRDTYVGVMKGVILAICPGLQLVDLTHEIPPQDIAGGAFQLARAAPYFPAETVHLAVVDPGVGGQRRAVALRTEQGYFVGPDNGLFSRLSPVLEVVELEAPPAISPTFHGRDLFAPAAARLARGEPLSDLGSHTKEPLMRLPQTSGFQILWIDHFGNALTDFQRDQGQPEAVVVAGRRLPFQRTYSQVAAGELLCLFGSDGYLELACNCGSAAEMLDLRPGQPVEVRKR